ncbi:Ig-like domain-containing protein [Enhygromyxa salina]|uniref:Beta-propeller repeat protein n=1 Tax=Enhygromyxa salina TaxID=215803 RepID=A0A2S9XXA7_9BACT|nr:Ig-like domain-containing protein [Enhygromyxa salina]PRP97351.1 hypothetical protein ENSA7_67010 [Enhygromyxa salina]
MTLLINRHRVLDLAVWLAPCLALTQTLGCTLVPFCDAVPDSQDCLVADGSGTGGDGDVDGSGDGDGDGDGSETGDGDGDHDQPPSIDVFTINGDEVVFLVEAAGGVALQVIASDPDGDLARVEFEADNQLLGSVSGAGPEFDLEWLLSGPEHNGQHTVTVTAYDAADNASAPVSLELGVSMPDGGTELDQWTYDGGLLDAVYDVAVSPDGDQVVLAGQTSTMNGSGQRVDRVVGQAWADKLELTSISASGVVWADGTFVVAGSEFANMEINTMLYAYDTAGAVSNQWLFDGSKPELGNPELSDLPSGLERDSSGRLYAIGTYTPQSGPLIGMKSSYMLAVTPNGDQEWLRWPTESPDIDGAVLLTELTVAPTGDLAAVGTNVTSGELWMSRWDADGLLLSELTLAEGSASEGHAIAAAKDGALVIGGGVETNGDLASWLRKVDANDAELWTAAPAQTGAGVTAAIAVDPWGEIVSVSTEGCDVGGGGLLVCELVARKYDADGTLMWTATWDAQTLSGPVNNLPGFDASVAIDRFGYIYVTAIVYTMNTGTDWWMRKLNP